MVIPFVCYSYARASLRSSQAFCDATIIQRLAIGLGLVRLRTMSLYCTTPANVDELVE